MPQHTPKHAASPLKPNKLDTPELRAERMATIMDLTVDQLRDMLLDLAVQEPAIFDAVRFSAL